MPITRDAEEIAFLQRVDAAWRNGEFQETIAAAEKARGFNTGSASSLRNKLNSLGWKLERIGGMRVVDTLLGRDLTDWIKSGELVAAGATVLAHEAEQVPA